MARLLIAGMLLGCTGCGAVNWLACHTAIGVVIRADGTCEVSFRTVPAVEEDEQE